MDAAAQAHPGCMFAILGGDENAPELIAELCKSVSDKGYAAPVNFNCPGQTVVSGSHEGVDKAIAGAKAAGFKLAKKLNVAGAYHSRYMKSAQQKLLPELTATPMRMPSCPVYCNYEARPVTSTEDIRAMLGAQVCGSVRWADSMQKLIDQGERLFIEMGPGKTLSGMMGRICKEARVISIEDAAGLEAAIAELKG